MSKDIQYYPQFLGPVGGRHFVQQVSPADEPHAHVVYVPPFGEEMNRCRGLVAEQARAFARAGYVCTLVDFVGTGDSDGELVDANLSDWYANLDTTLAHLTRETPLPINLWGMRLGGLLALDYAHSTANEINNVLLWQPVTNARMYVTQVLRQRVASLMVKELPPETTKEIRQRLTQGESVEVAGYSLGGKLLDDLEAIDLAALKDICPGAIHWLEHVAEQGKEPGVAASRAIEQLRSLGNTIELETFSDPQIWQIHERDKAPQLLEATARISL